MPIYHMKDDEITIVENTTFSEQGLKERQDLQRLLKNKIEIISGDTLVVSEEFGEWEDSRRRIDLLGIDKDANLVVIELKSSLDGMHMDLQAIRYAAMISTLTFDKLTSIHAQYLEKNGIQESAEESLLNFLGWSEPDEDRFGKEVKIVLALASDKGFSKELTTAVMWLNDFNIDIKCIHLRPYRHHNGDVLLDVRSIIPLPETAEYQVRIQEKGRKARSFRDSKDHTKYNLTVGNESHMRLAKNRMMYHIISYILSDGASPKAIAGVFPEWGHLLFQRFEGELNSKQVRECFMKDDPGGTVQRSDRFFSNEDEPFYYEGETYVLSNQWGSNTPKGRFDAIKTARSLQEKFPHLDIKFEPAGANY